MTGNELHQNSGSSLGEADETTRRLVGVCILSVFVVFVSFHFHCIGSTVETPQARVTNFF